MPFQALRGAYIGQKTWTADYSVTTTIMRGASTAVPGIAAIGDDKNIIGLQLKDNKLQVYRLKNGKDSVFASQPVTAGKNLWLEMQVRNGHQISFRYSTDGNTYQPVNGNTVDGAYLPPWDRAVRAGLTSKGTENQIAIFENFSITPIQAQASR